MDFGTALSKAISKTTEETFDDIINTLEIDANYYREIVREWQENMATLYLCNFQIVQEIVTYSTNVMVYMVDKTSFFMSELMKVYKVMAEVTKDLVRTSFTYLKDYLHSLSVIVEEWQQGMVSNTGLLISNCPLIGLV